MAENARLAKITAHREASKKPAYSDFMTNFNKHPETNMLVRNLNESAIKRAIRNLILTNKGERKHQPEFGCDVRRALFENFSPEVTDMIKTYISDAIDQFEPRVNLMDVVVTPVEQQHLYVIMIFYEMLNKEEPETLTLQLYRVR